MRAVWAIAGSVVADALRRKVVYIVLAFAAFMAVSIPRLPSYGVGVDEAVFREVALALMYAAAVVVVLSLSANRIPGEVERRTVYNVLSKRVHRWEYLAGTIALFHFAVPFVLLLSGQIKRDRASLLRVAVLLLVMRMADLYWQVVPAPRPTASAW